MLFDGRSNKKQQSYSQREKAMTAQKEVDNLDKVQSIKADVAAVQITPSTVEVFVSSKLIYSLIGYYILFIVLAMALLIFLISSEQKQETLFRMFSFMASGAIIGSVLFQIRLLFSHYIKRGNFDTKWLGKYISAPWESVALSVVVFSLLRGGSVVLGGATNVDLGSTNGLSVFALGALVGFGMRDVVGWLSNLVKTMFPTEPQ